MSVHVVDAMLPKFPPDSYELINCKHGTFFLNDFDKDVSEHMRFYGEWAEGELQIFLSLVQEGDIVLDIGANIGAFTIPLAKKVGPNGRIHAFEPQSLINQRLSANVVLNGLENVNIYHAALGNHSGKIQVPYLNYKIESNFGGLSLASPMEGQTKEWSYDVALLTLDSINFYNPYSGKDCPTFIKIDVEMMEKYVLQGGVNTINRCRPMIHAENNNEKTTAGLVEQFYALDYVPYWEIQPNFNSKFKDIMPDISKGYHNMNMICVPKERLKAEGGNVVMVGYVQVEREKPLLRQYFLEIQPDGTMKPKYRQHT